MSSSQSDINLLGRLSAFALLSGLSDVHSGNVLFEDDSLRLLDTEMVCHPDIIHRFYRETVEGKFPNVWSGSSLALTRVEVLWDELLAHWTPKEDDIEQVIAGFTEGALGFSNKPEEWCENMLLLADVPCRADPMPFNSANPIIEQMETFDLPSVNSLSELKADLRVQARRMARHLGLDNALSEELVISWLRGEHLVHFSPSEDKTKQQIKKVGGIMPEKRYEVAVSWLAALYREWLLERSGLD